MKVRDRERERPAEGFGSLRRHPDEGVLHRSLDVLLSDPRLTLESIASREGKSERSIRMTLSLAFLAPEIVKAAVEGQAAQPSTGEARRLANLKPFAKGRSGNLDGHPGRRCKSGWPRWVPKLWSRRSLTS